MSSRQNTRLTERIDAVIFDMDGLMLDTERLNLKQFQKAANDFGYSELEEVYLQSVGLNSRDTETLFQRSFGPAFPYDKIRERWRQYAEEQVAQFGVPHKSGLLNLFGTLESLGYSKAVATSTRRDVAVQLLAKVQILHYFGTVVGGDEVAKGKPNPEIFLKAAQRLHVQPNRCVVFEDSPAGIRGAHAAGMIPILVPDLIEPSLEVRALAHRVLVSLDDAPVLFA